MQVTCKLHVKWLKFHMWYMSNFACDLNNFACVSKDDVKSETKKDILNSDEKLDKILKDEWGLKKE